MGSHNRSSGVGLKRQKWDLGCFSRITDPKLFLLQFSFLSGVALKFSHEVGNSSVIWTISRISFSLNTRAITDNFPILWCVGSLLRQLKKDLLQFFTGFFQIFLAVQVRCWDFLQTFQGFIFSSTPHISCLFYWIILSNAIHTFFYSTSKTLN